MLNNLCAWSLFEGVRTAMVIAVVALYIFAIFYSLGEGAVAITVSLGLVCAVRLNTNRVG